MRSILSLDPGVTTGVCYAEWDDKILNLEIGQYKFSHLELCEYINDHAPNFLVSERFDYRNSYTGANLIPVEMIGVIKITIELNNKWGSKRKIEHYEQSPSIQGDKAYWSNEKLKKYGVYAKGLEHGRSATKHLLYWWQFGPGYNIHKQANFTAYEMELIKCN